MPEKFKTKEDATKFLNVCTNAVFKIEDLQKKPAKKSPAAPFTTSTLQQEASRKLSYSVGQTMTVAQKLYEAGLITYMRTDSKNLSNDAIKAASDAINKMYGSEFVQNRKYSAKSKGAQEAHEAIRPTDLSKSSIEGDRSWQRQRGLKKRMKLFAQPIYRSHLSKVIEVGNVKGGSRSA